MGKETMFYILTCMMSNKYKEERDVSKNSGHTGHMYSAGGH